MRKKNKNIIFGLFSIFAFFVFFDVKEAKAQFLSLEPGTNQISAGEEFSVNVNLNTEEVAVAGADVKLTFNSNILEVTKVEKGDFFSGGGYNIGNGVLYIAGFFSEKRETKAGIGKVATIYLKGKKGGSSALTFVCSSKTNDTNILDASANDIVDCNMTKNGSYVVIGGNLQLTATPTTSSSFGQPTGSLPESGNVPSTIIGLGLGLILTFLGFRMAF